MLFGLPAASSLLGLVFHSFSVVTVILTPGNPETSAQYNKRSLLADAQLAWASGRQPSAQNVERLRLSMASTRHPLDSRVLVPSKDNREKDSRVCVEVTHITATPIPLVTTSPGVPLGNKESRAMQTPVGQPPPTERTLWRGIGTAGGLTASALFPLSHPCPVLTLAPLGASSLQDSSFCHHTWEFQRLPFFFLFLQIHLINSTSEF